MQPDLTGAIEAAEAEAITRTGECVCHEAYVSRGLEDPTCLFHQVDGMAEDLIVAALPHVLTALADQADTERAEAYERFVEAHGRWIEAKTEDAENSAGEDRDKAQHDEAECGYASTWLRAKAEETPDAA